MKGADPAEAEEAESHGIPFGSRGGQGGAGTRATSVHAAHDVLVPVDHRAGDYAGAVGEQEDDEVGDLADLPELAHRQGRSGPLLPAVAGVVEPALRRVLALGVG